MSYVIYNTETTYYMPGMKREGYASKGAATAALNRAAKKTARDHEIALRFESLYAENGGDFRAAYGTTAEEFGVKFVGTNSHITGRDLVVADDYSIAEAHDFAENIEKMVTRVNLMSRQEYQERANTPSYCSPACESYWSL